MKEHPEIIYMNESLLGDVETDEVMDDVQEQSGSCYEFVFSFDVDDNDKSAIKEIFYGSVMEPVLERLKNFGYVDGWDAEREFLDNDCSKIIGIYSTSRSRQDASMMLYRAKNLGFVVYVCNDHSDEDSFAFMAASMMDVLVSSNMCMKNRNVRMVASELASRDNHERTGYAICIAHDENIWSFYAGGDDGVLDKENVGKIHGSFVRTASCVGLIDAVDEAGSRYVVTTFGIGVENESMSLVDSSGNILTNIGVTLAKFKYGPKFCADGLLYVKFAEGCCNYITMDGRVLSNEDFSGCSPLFFEGYACVNRSIPKGFNLLSTDGTFLCKENYDWVENFVDGIAVVMKDKLYNFIDKTGKLVCGEWYEFIDFGHGKKRDVALVCISCKEGEYYDEHGISVRKKSNYVRRDGTLVLENWIPGKSDAMENGFAKVIYGTDSTCRFVREDGIPVSDEWFDDVCGWPECGIYAFKKNGYWQFMDTESGKLLFDGEWFDDVSVNLGFGDFKFYEVMKWFNNDGKKTLVSKTGVKCSDEWFYSVNCVGPNLVAAVRELGSPTMVIEWGKGIVQDNLKYCDEYDDGILTIAKSGDVSLESAYNGTMLNFIDDKTLRLVSDEWFIYTGKLENGFVLVKRLDNKGNEFGDVLAYKSGVLVSPKIGEGERLTRIYTLEPDELVAIEKTGRYNYFMYNIFDATGKQLLDKWIRFRPVAGRDGVVRIGPAAYVDYSGKHISFV